MADRLSRPAREQVASLYDGRLAVTGDDPRTVGWRSRTDQNLRFAVLLRDVDVSGRRVLDVGCGLGHLVPYLDDRTGGRFDYTGIDLAPNVVAHARQHHGGPGRRFEVAEIADLGQREFDVVLCSGALTLDTGDNESYARSALSAMYDSAREVVAVNFLSTYVDFEEPRNHHYDPGELFRFAKGLTRWVTLLHDYPLWEFTLQLRREPITIEGQGDARR